MYIVLSQDAKSSLRLQCNIAGNASEVAISSYTMAGWQHESKHAVVWRQCPLSPREQNQNKWPLFRVDVTVCDGVYEEHPQFTNYCSTRTQTLLANHLQLNEKPDFSNTMSKCASMEFVWNMEDLFHSILEPFRIPYRCFPSIPYHSMSWLP